MKHIAEYFKYIVFHDFWHTRHEMGFGNHNAADRNACYGRLISSLENGHWEEDFIMLKEFCDARSTKDTGVEVYEQACWSVGWYAQYLDRLSDCETIEDYKIKYPDEFSRSERPKTQETKITFNPDDFNWLSDTT